MAERRRASALMVEGEASESEDETLNSGHSCPGSPGIHKQKLVWVSPKIRFLETPSPAQKSFTGTDPNFVHDHLFSAKILLFFF